MKENGEQKEEEAAPMSRVHACLLVLAFCHSVPCSQLFLGFPAFAAVLEEEGQYAELCSKDDDDDPCDAQQSRISMIFTVASSAYAFGFFLFGLVLDRFGPRITAASATLCVATGCTMLAFCDSQRFDAFVPAYSLMAVGGPGLHGSLMHLSNLFRNQSVVQSFVTGNLLLSSLVLTLGMLSATSQDARKRYFLGLGCTQLILFVVGCLVWPSKSFERFERYVWKGFGAAEHAPNNNSNKLWWCIPELFQTLPPLVATPASTEAFSAIKDRQAASTPTSSAVVTQEETVQLPADNPEDATTQSALAAGEDGGAASERRAGNATGDDQSTLFQSNSERRMNVRFRHRQRRFGSQTAGEQMRSTEFVAVLVFGTVHVLRLNFYMAAAVTRLQDLGDDSNTYSYVLSLTLPLVAVFSIVPVGILQQHVGIPETMFVSNTLAMLYGATMLIPVLEVQILTFCLLAVHMQSLFATLYSYLATVFGFNTFGVLSGVVNLSIAIVSLSLFGLFALVDSVFGGNFFWVDLVVFLLFPLFVYISIGEAHKIFYSRPMLEMLLECGGSRPDTAPAPDGGAEVFGQTATDLSANAGASGPANPVAGHGGVELGAVTLYNDDEGPSGQI